jgi:arylsulfatase A-like enzyme
MLSGLDWFPTFLAAAGDSDITQRLLKGADFDGKTFKVHLDGYNQLPFLTGQQPKSARKEFAYFNDDGVGRLPARRLESRVCGNEAPGRLCRLAGAIYAFACSQALSHAMDPFERADIVSDQYNDWLVRNDFKMFQITTHAGAFLQTFVEYPPSQEQASFSIDQICPRR